MDTTKPHSWKVETYRLTLYKRYLSVGMMYFAVVYIGCFSGFWAKRSFQNLGDVRGIYF
jgi:hypothetical protein